MWPVHFLSNYRNTETSWAHYCLCVTLSSWTSFLWNTASLRSSLVVVLSADSYFNQTRTFSISYVSFLCLSVPSETHSADPLSSLQFVSDSIFLAGCCNGNIHIADTRTSAAPQLSPPPDSLGESALWWTDATSGPEPSSCRVIRLSSSGQATVSDLRNLGGAVSRAQLDVKTRPCSLDHVQVSWAPVLDQCIAVSGQLMSNEWNYRESDLV